MLPIFRNLRLKSKYNVKRLNIYFKKLYLRSKKFFGKNSIELLSPTITDILVDEYNNGNINFDEFLYTHLESYFTSFIIYTVVKKFNSNQTNITQLN